MKYNIVKALMLNSKKLDCCPAMPDVERDILLWQIRLSVCLSLCLSNVSKRMDVA